MRTTTLLLLVCAAAAHGANNPVVLVASRSEVYRYDPESAGNTGALAMEAAPDAELSERPSCGYFMQSVFCAAPGRSGGTAWRMRYLGLGGDAELGAPTAVPVLHAARPSMGNGRLASVADRFLFACGGDDDGPPRYTCEALEVRAAEWTALDNTPDTVCTRRAAVAAHGLTSAYIGGGDCDRTVGTVWAAEMSYSDGGEPETNWHQVPSMGIPRDQHSMHSHKGYLYACGGHNSNASALSDCERWREGMAGWEPVARMPAARLRLQLVSAGDALLAMGGVDGQMRPHHDVWSYDAAADRWTALHDMPDMGGRPFAAVMVYRFG